jgi:hypothetical protein
MTKSQGTSTTEALAPSSSNTSSTAPAPSITNSSASPTPTPSSTNSSAPYLQPASADKITSNRHAATGAIAGGATGGVAVVLVLLGVWFFHRRRHPGMKGGEGPVISKSDSQPKPGGDPTLEPFMLERSVSSLIPPETGAETKRGGKADPRLTGSASAAWVSRAEYEAEIGTLRAQVDYLKRAQHPDWIHEMPPAY